MDLVAHFPITKYLDKNEQEPVRKRFRGVCPDHVDEDSFAPTLEWAGVLWDGDPDQLVLGREDGEPYPDGEGVWNALAQTATSFDFEIKPNLERSSADTSMFFFDVEGSGTFDPQDFIDRFSKFLYGE